MGYERLNFSRNQVEKGVLKIFPKIPIHFVNRFLDYCQISSEQLQALAKYKFNKPYGYNHIIEDEGEYGLSFAQFDLNKSTSYHYHEIRKEFFFVRKSTMTLLKNSNVIILSPGTFNQSEPFEKHSIKNDSNSMLEVLEIFSPPLLDDKIRIEDYYGRPIGKVNRLE